MTEVIVRFPDIDTAREVALCAEMGMAHAYVDRERVREGIKTVRTAIADADEDKS
jgi:hypothetical protein